MLTATTSQYLHQSNPHLVTRLLARPVALNRPSLWRASVSSRAAETEQQRRRATTSEEQSTSSQQDVSDASSVVLLVDDNTARLPCIPARYRVSHFHCCFCWDVIMKFTGGWELSNTTRVDRWVKPDPKTKILRILGWVPFLLPNQPHQCNKGTKLVEVYTL